jgi:hypothetical protein
MALRRGGSSMERPNSVQMGKKLRLVETKSPDGLIYRLYRGDRLIAEIEDMPFDMLDLEGHPHTAGAVMDINSNTIATKINPFISGRNKRKQEAAFNAAPLKLKPIDGDPSKGVIISKLGSPICSIRVDTAFTAFIYCAQAQGFLE